jgi:hypothetical protein
MDSLEISRFIEYQFRRLGMFYGKESDVRHFFLNQIKSDRSKWWLLCCVVDYINKKEKEYFSWCDR